MTPTADATLYVRFGSNWRGRSLFQGRPLFAHRGRLESTSHRTFVAELIGLIRP
jgi:hypothetical protein